MLALTYPCIVESGLYAGVVSFFLVLISQDLEFGKIQGTADFNSERTVTTIDFWLASYLSASAASDTRGAMLVNLASRELFHNEIETKRMEASSQGKLDIPVIDRPLSITNSGRQKLGKRT